MNLCVESNCSLCCDGTLYSQAPLTKEDASLHCDVFEVKRADKNSRSNSYDTFFDLPCEMCVDQACSIYNKVRPKICGEYKCILYAEYESKTISLEKASLIIQNVKHIRDNLRPQLEKFLEIESSHSIPSLVKMVAAKVDEKNINKHSFVLIKMLHDIGMFRIRLAKRFDSRLTKPTWLADKLTLRPID